MRKCKRRGRHCSGCRRGRGDFAPHTKSMPLGKLAPHVAQLGGFGMVILTEPGLDFVTRKFTPLPFESADQLVRAFDEGTANVRKALKEVRDDQWNEPWKLSAGGRTISRDRASSLTARCSSTTSSITVPARRLPAAERAPVPSTYGPSADDTLGFWNP